MATATWNDPKYLAGLIDGEGCFTVHIYEPAPKYCYPFFAFRIRLLATKEWIDIANYMKEVYRGWTNYEDGKKYYGHGITATEELLNFLNRYIPLLIIKKEEAQNLRNALLDYKAIKDKAKPTIEEWLRKHKLR